MAYLRPLVGLALKFLGPGHLRLQMVKLAHDLDDPDAPRLYVGRDHGNAEPGQRAA